jgi:hypothetical protein
MDRGVNCKYASVDGKSILNTTIQSRLEKELYQSDRNRNRRTGLNAVHHDFYTP